MRWPAMDKRMKKVRYFRDFDIGLWTHFYLSYPTSYPATWMGAAIRVMVADLARELGRSV